MIKILIINGPNLNMLGLREKKHYGSLTLKELNEMIIQNYLQVEFEFFQSNHEGEIIDTLQKSNDFDGILINPGGFCHTSIAILDALLILNIPKVEVHLSDISKREQFRSQSVTSTGCDKVCLGKKEFSYFEAIDYVIEKKLKSDKKMLSYKSI